MEHHPRLFHIALMMKYLQKNLKILLIKLEGLCQTAYYLMVINVDSAKKIISLFKENVNLYLHPYQIVSHLIWVDAKDVNKIILSFKEDVRSLLYQTYQTVEYVTSKDA